MCDSSQNPSAVVLVPALHVAHPWQVPRAYWVYAGGSERGQRATQIGGGVQLRQPRLFLQAGRLWAEPSYGEQFHARIDEHLWYRCVSGPLFATFVTSSLVDRISNLLHPNPGAMILRVKTAQCLQHIWLLMVFSMHEDC